MSEMNPVERTRREFLHKSKALYVRSTIEELQRVAVELTYTFGVWHIKVEDAEAGTAFACKDEPSEVRELLRIMVLTRMR